MDETTARAMIKAQFDASNIAVAGGGPEDTIARAYTIRSDDRPVMVVGIMAFRDGKVVRERIYFGEPWDPPAWRAQWVELFDPRKP